MLLKPLLLTLILLALSAQVSKCSRVQQLGDESAENSDEVETDDEDYGDTATEEPDDVTVDDETDTRTNDTNIFVELADTYKQISQEVVKQLFPYFVKRVYELQDGLSQGCMSSILNIFYAIRDQKAWALNCE